MKNSIRHTGIVVQNLNKVLNFWIKIMGFKIEKKLRNLVVISIYCWYKKYTRYDCEVKGPQGKYD